MVSALKRQAAILRADRPLGSDCLALVCLPYAGGGSATFRGWQQHARLLDVVPAHLPGRDSRFGEPPFRSIETAVEALIEAVSMLDREFALFGHSMGALMAFEVARRLDAVGNERLRQVFISGCRPPQAPPLAPVHDLPTPELLRYVAQLGGLPADVLELTELLELMLPTLRADFAIVDTYRYTEGPAFSYPMHVLHGDADPHCGRAEALGWAQHTRATFNVSEHRGNHFFPFNDPSPIVKTMERVLLPIRRPSL